MCSTHVHDMCIVQHGVTFLSQFIRSLFNLFQTNLKSSRGNARHVHDDQELVNLTLFTLQQCSTDPSGKGRTAFKKLASKRPRIIPDTRCVKSIIGNAGWMVWHWWRFWRVWTLKSCWYWHTFDLEGSLPSYYLFLKANMYIILNIHCISIYRLYSRNPVHAACT